MKLTHITFQGGVDDGQRKFSEYYKEHFTTGGSAEFNEHGVKMLELIRYLEQEVNAPPQWVCTSHADIVLHNRDSVDYSEAVDAEDVVTLSISTHTWDGRYEIKCYLPKSEHPWQFLAGTTEDVEIAAQMVVDALKKAPQA
jgi:hypothetical protein